MKTPRRKFSASFKAKVAIEAIKEQTSIPELAAKFELHPAQLSTWKREFLKNAELAFEAESQKDLPRVNAAPLKSLIGPVQVEKEVAKIGLGKRARMTEGKRQ